MLQTAPCKYPWGHLPQASLPPTPSSFWTLLDPRGWKTSSPSGPTLLWISGFLRARIFLFFLRLRLGNTGGVPRTTSSPLGASRPPGGLLMTAADFVAPLSPWSEAHDVRLSGDAMGRSEEQHAVVRFWGALSPKRSGASRTWCISTRGAGELLVRTELLGTVELPSVLRFREPEVGSALPAVCSAWIQALQHSVLQNVQCQPIIRTPTPSPSLPGTTDAPHPAHCPLPSTT